MAMLNQIEAFQPENGASWELYVERLNFYFEANDITSAEKKRAILMSVCGPSAFVMIRSLLTPRSLNEVTFEEIVSKVKEHFNPAPSEIVFRLRFHKRSQRLNESITEYVAALRNLSENCNFGNTLGDMLRDRFVGGIRDEAIQRRLLAEPKLTFDLAQKIAIAAETAHKNTEEIRTPNNEFASIQQVRNSNSAHRAKQRMEQVPAKSGGSCYRCKGNHHPSKCKFINEACRFCKKIGHIERACLTKLRAENNSSRKAGRAQPRGFSRSQAVMTNQLREECGDEDCYTRNKVIIEAAKAIMLTVYLNGKPLKMEIDSGSACSIISDETFKSLWPVKGPKITRTKKRLQTWSKQKLQTLGTTDVEVQWKDRKSNLSLLVVKGVGASLLGRNWFDALGITINGVHHITEKQPEAILQEYRELFKEELGTYRGPAVTVETDTAVVPKFLKCRPVPFALREKVNAALDDLIRQGILKPTQYSRWATPIVPVQKKNGDLRICGDYRCTVNLATKNQSYPLPTISEVLSSLAGGIMFSKLDLAQAYQQLQVDEITEELLTLNTPRGLMKVCRLPFGVNVAPAIFQRLMDTHLADIAGVKPYLDDILISGSTKEEHDERLKKVLQRLVKLGLRLKKEKCVLATDEVEFLGFRINARGVQPTQDKVKAIHAAPRPTNRTELQAFLGLVNFYSCFMPRKASIVEPLHRLLDKKQKWIWGKQHERAFEEAKSLLQSSSVLAHYNTNLPLQVTCDASPYGVGAVLSHVMSDGTEAPVAYASRTLTTTERNYAQIDKEALAIVFGVKKFHQYLYGRYFTIVTDHKPLLGLLKPHNPIPQTVSPRMLRWSLLLSAYNYELCFKNGKYLANADALSRLPVVTKDFRIEEPTDVLFLEMPPDAMINAQHIAEETKKDRVLSRVLRWTLCGWPETKLDTEYKIFHNKRAELSVHRNCLIWGNRVVIPDAQKQEVMDMLHQAHPGIVRMKCLARSYVWWPGIDNDIEQKVKRCTPCQESRNAPEKAPVHIWEETDQPWSRLHIDFAGPCQGKTFLVVVDSYSKWLEVRPVPTTSSAAAISNLRQLFTTHGLPEVIVSDNATAFTSKEFQRFMVSNAIRHITIAPYHPASNGQAERMVQTVKKALQRIVKGNWNIHLARFLLSQHITPNSKTGLSPAELLMHRRPRTLLDNLHPDRAKISSNRQNIQQRNAENAKETRTFHPQQPVYIKNYSKEDKWSPAIIERQTGPVSYDTRTPEGERHRRHVDQLRPRVDTSKEKIQEKENEENRRKEGTEGRSPEERTTEETEVGDGNTERTTSTDGPDGHRPVRKKCRPKYLEEYICKI
ncbi:Transposon Tf2-11 polyprotein [Trichinella papuae]|uniref:RNA-directed DNA polymerase n=1 Tax=Trichinella papuae TaxID=268474 RepID=A0A0V1MIE6_9BILA|nr:Transposon Tf2-11 polyprotein [Trichinella papuae]